MFCDVDFKNNYVMSHSVGLPLELCWFVHQSLTISDKVIYTLPTHLPKIDINSINSDIFEPFNSLSGAWFGSVDTPEITNQSNAIIWRFMKFF